MKKSWIFGEKGGGQWLLLRKNMLKIEAEINKGEIKKEMEGNISLQCFLFLKQPNNNWQHCPHASFGILFAGKRWVGTKIEKWLIDNITPTCLFEFYLWQKVSRDKNRKMTNWQYCPHVSFGILLSWTKWWVWAKIEKWQIYPW